MATPLTDWTHPGGAVINVSALPEAQRMQLPLENDWLFGRQTDICNETLSYENSIQPADQEARLFMAGFSLMCVLLVVMMPRKPLDAEGEPSPVVHRPNPRWEMLDAVRIVAIVGVVCEHSGGSAYSFHNVGFTTLIVLPWLFLVSGIAFMMSRSSALAYFGRLLLLLVVGLGCNVCGDVIARPGWYEDIGNTIFQMSYVIALILFALIAWPLRAALREDCPRDCLCIRSVQLPLWSVAACVYYSAAWLGLTALYLSGFELLPPPGTNGSVVGEDGSWGAHVRPIVVNAPFVCSHVAGLLMLVTLHAALSRARDGLLPWLLLVYIYLPRVLFPMTYALAPAMILLFILGLTVQAHPFYGADRLVTLGRPYWLFLGTFLVVFSVPSLLGRCDLYPATTLWERIRWDGSELILNVLLLTKVLAASDPLGIVAPLSWWALFAFVTHVALARVLQPSSLGAALEFALMPVFVVGYKLLPKRGTPAPSLSTSDPSEKVNLFASPPSAWGREGADAAYGTFHRGTPSAA